MLVDLYNQEGQKLKQIRLPKEIFGKGYKPDLVHQVVVAMRSNRRQGTAHTKDRSEKRGGGAKPWRQKGTGRARAGSNRSPLWKGGGVTFGPRKERNYKKRVPKKMKKAALFSVLSQKAKEGEILIIDAFGIEKPKTKIITGLLENLFQKTKKEALKSALLVLAERNDKLLRAVGNIPKVGIKEARNLNVLDLLNFKYLIMEKDSMKKITARHA